MTSLSGGIFSVDQAFSSWNCWVAGTFCGPKDFRWEDLSVAGTLGAGTFDGRKFFVSGTFSGWYFFWLRILVAWTFSILNF